MTGKPNAHHMVPLNQGAGVAGNRARAVQQEVGIGIDSAPNGARPPTEAGVTDATLHDYDVHSPAALEKIANRREDALRTAKGAGLIGDALTIAVCDELDKIHAEISKGEFDPYAQGVEVDWSR